MLAHPITEQDFDKLKPQDFMAEFKWDGIRVQAVCGRDEAGHLVKRLYSRTDENISMSFPDIISALNRGMTIDGELLIKVNNRIYPFSALQKRLNRKTVSKRMMQQYPAHLQVYDLLALDGQDLRPSNCLNNADIY